MVTRGSALRSEKKELRVASHEPVLKYCLAELDIQRVIEHGMGKSSTAVFHERRVQQLFSYESNPQWATCPNCPGSHVIRPLVRSTFLAELSSIPRAGTLVFIDGADFDNERLFVLAAALKLGFETIVEHDAESFTHDAANKRREMIQAMGYVGFQYVGENPETALYANVVPGFVKRDSLYVPF